MSVAGRWIAPFLILCVAGLLLPFLVFLLWDAVSITAHDLWGLQLETAPQLILELAPVFEHLFPGASAVANAASPPSFAPGAVIASLLAAYVLAAAKGLIPPFGPRQPRPDLVLAFGLGDAVISIGLGLVVASVISTFASWFDNVFGLVIGIMVLVAMLAVTILAALGRLVRGNVTYAFRLMLSLGQVFLAWWSAAGWSLNSYAGSAATLLAVAGCGMLEWVKFLGERRVEARASSEAY